MIKQQATTLGELDGRSTPRLQQIANAFTNAGFPIALASNLTFGLGIASMGYALWSERQRSRRIG